MPTPQITVRVKPDDLERWKRTCDSHSTDVSSQIRVLMEAWCWAEDRREEYESLAFATLGLDERS